MKLLFVCQSYPFKQGGVETRLRETALHASRNGHEVTLLCAKTDVNDPDFEQFEGIKVHCRKILPDAWIRRWPYPHYFPLAASKILLGHHIRKLHSREGFEVIREDMAPVPVTGLWALTGFKGARRVLLVHNLPGKFSVWRKIYGTLYGSIGYLFEILLKRGWLRFERIHAVSPFMARNFDLYPRLSGKVRLVYNGIRLSEFAGSFGICKTAKDLRFLSVGRLVPLKAFSTLLEAFAGAIRAMPRASLCIVGDGPERDRLEAFAGWLEIKDLVEFRGEISHSKMPQTYREFDCFVMPSVFEGFSIVTLEAMASGLPLVLSDIPGLRDIVGDEAALFFQAGNAGDLAAKLLWAFENPDAMRDKAEKALSIAQKFDWGWVCEREKGLMQEMGPYA